MTKNFTSVTLWHKIYLGLNKILLEATTHPNNKLWWYWRLLFFHVFYFSRFIVVFFFLPQKKLLHYNNRFLDKNSFRCQILTLLSRRMPKHQTAYKIKWCANTMPNCEMSRTQCKELILIINFYLWPLLLKKCKMFSVFT